MWQHMFCVSVMGAELKKHFRVQKTRLTEASFIHSIILSFFFLSFLPFFLPSFIHSFIHLLVCITTGPQPLPKPVLHTVRSSVSCFNFQYPLFSLRSSSSFLHLLSRPPVTFILPSFFNSIMCFKRQFLPKM